MSLLNLTPTTVPMSIRLISSLAGMLFSLSCLAHPGGTDANGGHINRETNVYHCHSEKCVLPNLANQSAENIEAVSFNIQFLGNFKTRNNRALTELLAPYDLVLVQELVAPPYAGTFPDGTAYKPDKEAQVFFDMMQALGFVYYLSEEDTGTGDKIHLNSSATEWWVVFFKPDRISIAADLPSGFLSADRSNHEDYERVPYAFGLRTVMSGNDFVLISVHLQPGGSGKNTNRRQTELTAIAEWINEHDDTEKDFFIVGDMNFEDCAEIAEITPADLIALNSGSDCINTNTHPDGKPYDNVLFTAAGSKELQDNEGLEIIDLIGAMEKPWQAEFAQPFSAEDPEHRKNFRTRFSDHHPITFRLRVAEDDD